MTQPTNDQRAEWAAAALDHYGITKERRAAYDVSEAMATDLIADLLHLVRGQGFDPALILKRAKVHFDAEEVEEEAAV